MPHSAASAPAPAGQNSPAHQKQGQRVSWSISGSHPASGWSIPQQQREQGRCLLARASLIWIIRCLCCPQNAAGLQHPSALLGQLGALAGRPRCPLPWDPSLGWVPSQDTPSCRSWKTAPSVTPEAAAPPNGVPRGLKPGWRDRGCPWELGCSGAPKGTDVSSPAGPTQQAGPKVPSQREAVCPSQALFTSHPALTPRHGRTFCPSSRWPAPHQ